MGRQDYVIQAEVGRFLERLVAEYIERRAGDMARADGLGQRVIDDEFAARAVDDAYAGLHPLDGLGVD